MPNEFFLIIFLMVAMLVFVSFYAKRARARDRAASSKAEQQGADEAKS